MMKPLSKIALLALLTLGFTAAKAEDIVDITNRFDYTWGQGENQTHNSDGSITYVARPWGGLAAWIDDNWDDYASLVFEFVQTTPCAVQPVVQYKDGSSESNWTAQGVTEAYIDLNPDRRWGVNQVALQAASNATLRIARIYLVKAVGEAVDDSPEADEEQDARLLVNELMQSNIDCVMDDLKEFPDSWVELYNAGTTAARLNRYSLGITPQADEAWPLPNRKVKAGGRMLVYCDKAADSLHTNYRLESAKGCQVYLFRDGQLIDHVAGLKKQPAPNIAYGRATDGADTWGYQLTPTPGEANGGGICDHGHILGEPVFSEQGRVTTAGGIVALRLTVPEGSPEGTVVRYTTDGTEPTAESKTAPTVLRFGQTTVVRAKLFCDGWLSPRSTTQSYIFFPRELTLPVVSIATDDSYLNGGRLGIFANNSNERRNNWRRPINIEFFFGEDEASQLNQLCETRVAGAASRSEVRKSMAIYAHKRFGTKRFQYEFFPDQRPGDTNFKSLVLRNAGNDFNYLYMRDAIVQCAMASHTDLDWQAWRPAIVYINGEYRGMLNIRERGNESNVFTHYDELEDIDLIENWNDLKEGTWDNYNQFAQFFAAHGHTMAEYEEWMDCQEFINLMAMNLYFNNFDFPGNNIIMWRPRAEGGRWRWIAKDCDYTMGIYNQGPAGYKILEWLYNPGYDGAHNWGANGYGATRLFRRLMEDADFKREFIDHLAVYMGDFLNETGIRAVWDPMYEQIKTEFPYHRANVGNQWSNYNSDLTAARNWVKQRTAQFYSHLASYYGVGTPVPMQVTAPDGQDESPAAISFNGIGLSAGTFDGRFFVGRNFTLEGKPAAGREVSGWKVQQISGGSSTTQEVAGPLLSMAMPQCTRLIVTPVMTDALAIASVGTQHFSWQMADGYLYLSGVPQGTDVRLYDLRGMLLESRRAQGADDMVLPVRQGQTYVLRVGSETLKIR